MGTADIAPSDSTDTEETEANTDEVEIANNSPGNPSDSELMNWCMKELPDLLDKHEDLPRICKRIQKLVCNTYLGGNEILDGPAKDEAKTVSNDIINDILNIVHPEPFFDDPLSEKTLIADLKPPDNEDTKKPAVIDETLVGLLDEILDNVIRDSAVSDPLDTAAGTEEEGSDNVTSMDEDILTNEPSDQTDPKDGDESNQKTPNNGNTTERRDLTDEEKAELKRKLLLKTLGNYFKEILMVKRHRELILGHYSITKRKPKLNHRRLHETSAASIDKEARQ
jgi:hypothetical protein